MATDAEIRALARKLWRENDIEIDDNAIVSRNDEDRGAYVAAWLWVNFLEDDGCECCYRSDLTLHSCPNADCGKLLCQDCLDIHDCGPTDPANPPSLEECTYQCQKCTKVWVETKTVPECSNCGSADVLEIEIDTEDYDVSG